MSTNRRIANAGKSKYSWLSGKLRCGYCGSSITTTTQYNGVYYLGCTGKKLRQDCDGIGRALKVPEIEAIVEKQIILLCNNQGLLKKSKAQATGRSRTVETHIKVIDQKIDNLIEQVALGSVAVGKYINEKIEALEHEKRLLLELSQSSQDLDDTDVFTIISIAAKWNTLDMDERKDVCSQLIEAVAITNDSVSIAWKKPFDVL
jgi:hypothetical protein